jgi:acetolactate synthase-1/2/3 large subunit
LRDIVPVKLSDYVIDFVARQGVKHVFFVPGGAAMHLNESLGQHRDLTYVCNLHEQASSVAAESYAKVTNQLAAVMVTAGPGGTNAMTGLSGAWLDSTPVIFLSGQVKRADLKGDSGLRMLGAQETDIVSLVKAITKYAVTITDPLTIRFHLEQAVYLAMRHRRGPVWLDIPLDVQAAMIEPESQPGFSPPKSVVEDPTLVKSVSECISLLNQSERPVLLVGHGIHSAGAREELHQLINVLRIPVLTTWLGLDLVPDAHPLLIGRPGAIAPRGANFTIQNSDLLWMIGARMDMATTAYHHEKLARAARKIMVDVDPAEIAKMKTTIHVPVQADAKAFLQEVLRQRGGIQPRLREDWIKRCQNWKARYPVVLPEHRHETGPVSIYHFSDVLTEALAEGDVVAPGSSGFAVEIFFLVYRAKAGQRVIHNRGTGAMGLAQASAIGACLASGSRRTISVDGDGGFQMNIQELATVANLQLPIKFFVVNNDGYASIRSSQTGYFNGHLVGADRSSGLKLPDLSRIAQAYDLPTFRITDGHGLRAKIQSVLDTAGPAVCEVISPADEPRGPRVASAQRPDGSMVSKPLEDLWPFLSRDEFLSNMIVPPLPE